MVGRSDRGKGCSHEKPPAVSGPAPRRRRLRARPWWLPITGVGMITRRERRRRSFLALLVADLVSTLGSEMAAVALPWFVLATTGSPPRTRVAVGAAGAGIARVG